MVRADCRQAFGPTKPIHEAAGEFGRCPKPDLECTGSAIDAELSQSKLFETEALNREHVETAACAREHIFEYDHFNLHHAVKRRGDNFLYTDDGGITRERMKRTRRLKFFLTQGYHGTEMWSGQPGETVPLSHTVETCRRILDGEFAEVPEKAWYMMGRMESILARTIED